MATSIEHKTDQRESGAARHPGTVYSLIVAGEVFGDLMVIEDQARLVDPVKCQCVCGFIGAFVPYNLRKGASKSCGCRSRKVAGDRMRTHGMTGTAEYRAWKAMRARCANPNEQYFYLYGGRGITVCERWNEFSNFWEDMGPRPSPRHSVDRIDVNGTYEPGNCRWATAQEQRLNQRRTIQKGKPPRRSPLITCVACGEERIHRTRGLCSTCAASHKLPPCRGIMSAEAEQLRRFYSLVVLARGNTETRTAGAPYAELLYRLASGGTSIVAMAKVLNISPNAVHSTLRRHGYQERLTRERMAGCRTSHSTTGRQERVPGSVASAGEAS